jgi:hypothetical protein
VRIYATKTKTYRTETSDGAFLERLRKMREENESGYLVEYARHAGEDRSGIVSIRLCAEPDNGGCSDV